MRSPRLSVVPNPPARITASDVSSPKRVGWNRQVYQRLKLAFKLGLRRQIFIAVCDDLARRDSLAAQLQSELGVGSDSSPPCFVSLRLNLTDPDPISQVNRWLTQHHLPLRSKTGCAIPGFQILGVEQLTRQPAAVQWSFLNGLRQIPTYLPRWEPSLLLWVSRPWLHSIEQSAPEFWRCCTGIFEFQGEPTGRDAPDVTSSKSTTQIPPKPPKKSSIEIPAQTRSPSKTADSQITPDLSFSHVDRELAEGVLMTLDLARATTWEPLRLLQQIERLHRQESSATELADGYQTLGNLYRDRLNRGNASPLEIRVAISTYTQAMEYLTGETSAVSETTITIAAELGTLYGMLSRGVAKPEEQCRHLQQSLEFDRAVLAQIEPSHPLWMRVQQHLGGVYADLARYEDAAENLEKSAIAFEEVLRGRDIEGNSDSDPMQDAAIHNSLGTTYWSLAQHREPLRHLQQAIAAYDRALEIYTAQKNRSQKNAIDYAMVLNNLGTAYWMRSRQENPRENLLLAVDAYRKALDYRTPETLPIGCAATQNNLATAYWHLARQGETEAATAEYLQQAIAAYETAVTVAESVGEKALPFDRFAAHNNLGLAYYQWVTHPLFDGTAETRQQHLEAALHHHLLALEGWQQQPERYQTALDYVVQTIRAFYNDGDIRGQNLAFSKLPSGVLPKVMERL